MDEDIQPRLRYAESDMVSAEALHRVGEELNAIFHLQQAVEKTIKALYIKVKSKMPPRLHSLQNLARDCDLKLTEGQSELLDDLTSSYIESRYPEEWVSAPPEVSGEKTAKLIDQSKDFIAWLKQKL